MEWIKGLIGKKEVPVEEVTKEQRRSFRVKLSFSCTLVAAPNAFPAYIHDFSHHGARIMSANQLKVNSIVTVILRGKGGGKEIELKGRIVWCRKFKNDSDYSAGLEYTEFKNIKTFGELVDFIRREKHLDTLGSDTTQKRKTTRLMRRFPVRYKVPGGMSHEGFTRDLSDTGVRFACHEQVPEGQEMEVMVDLQDGKEPLLVIGDVVRCGPIQGEDFFDVAIHMVHLVEGDRKRLERLLRQTLRNELNG